jgi:hypothetical protein
MEKKIMVPQQNNSRAVWSLGIRLKIGRFAVQEIVHILTNIKPLCY